MPEPPDITGLLKAVKQGETGAESQLFSLLYADLRQIARQRLRRSTPCTLLDTTALVHEAYLRLHGAGYIHIADRAHFLAYAASVMRSIVVDLVRKRGTARRVDGDVSDISALPAAEKEILRVDEALEQLAQVSDRMVRVVEMRYFAGMKEAEIAEALSLNERTVRRDWEKARMVLAAALK